MTGFRGSNVGEKQLCLTHLLLPPVYEIALTAVGWKAFVDDGEAVDIVSIRFFEIRFHSMVRNHRQTQLMWEVAGQCGNAKEKLSFETPSNLGVENLDTHFDIGLRNQGEYTTIRLLR